MAPDAGSSRKRKEPELPSSLQKKRRLNDLSKFSPTTPKSTPGVGSSAVKKSSRKTAPAVSSPYEVPDSPEEGAPPKRIRNVRSVNRPTPKVPIAARGQINIDAYHVPDSDDELHLNPKEVNAQKASPTVRKSGGIAKAVVPEPKQKAARKRVPSQKSAINVVELDPAEEIPTTEETGVKARASGRRRIPTAKVLEEQLGGIRSGTPVSRATSSAADDVQETKNATGKAVRNVSMPLKGILTPSRRDGTPRRSKSVAFDNEQSKEEVFFEDLPTKSGRSKQTPAKATPKAASTTKPRRPAPKAVEEDPVEEDEEEEPELEVEGGPAEEEEESEDEDICVVCSKPDSKAGNKILFCDGCDGCYHQKCHNVPKVPKGDWYCDDCVQQKESRVLAAGEVAKIPNFAQHLNSMKRVLLDRCTGRRRIKLIDQDEAYEKAHQLVEQTVLAGEGNSMLVIGARGCGKTTLVESIVSDLSLQYKKEFHVVRLNGFIHTDDKLALKEIWRQLGKEMEAEDDITARSNYADTMASLLALLSHPSEMAQAEEGVTSQAVIFVIDEFDMFAAHPRQTLLYNLFEIAQARKAPIAVLGCTTRMDVVEMLEKRVKSRFSHRYVYLSMPKSLPAYWNVCKQGLTVDEEDMEVEGIDVSVEGHEAFYANWNAMIEVLRKGKSFQNLLQCHYATSKSVSAFWSECILPLSSLSLEAPDLVLPPPAGSAVSLRPPNSKLHILPSLSELDLGLLIAAARLDIVAHTDTVNFAMAYDEYSSLMGRQRVQSASSGMLALGGGVRVWGRGVAGTAWERLVSLGLLVPAGLGTGRASGYGGLEGKMWKVDMALEEIPVGVKLNNVLARWCKEI
ncbi:Origin recognition complex subunit 4 [Colletotrichum siamense]|uniref:Origin recognition complex subunit 4 n=1 Tax=Colletotrichum siamense TaxID=690259 RepID=UPI0018727857|nr:Origin recognition complex subunit 4 [Colletotrichum siamense]KAF5505810.1 Origin recognition complex subunit 4 [Colletotrichum siamense]